MRCFTIVACAIASANAIKVVSETSVHDVNSDVNSVVEEGFPMDQFRQVKSAVVQIPRKARAIPRSVMQLPGRMIDVFRKPENKKHKKPIAAVQKAAPQTIKTQAAQQTSRAKAAPQTLFHTAPQTTSAKAAPQTTKTQAAPQTTRAEAAPQTTKTQAAPQTIVAQETPKTIVAPQMIRTQEPNIEITADDKLKDPVLEDKVRQSVDDVFLTYDSDPGSVGKLTKEETRTFIEDTIIATSESFEDTEIDDEDFDEIFKQLDLSGDGFIDRKELRVFFVKQVLQAQ